MNQLYPIIRRARRPLLPEESLQTGTEKPRTTENGARTSNAGSNDALKDNDAEALAAGTAPEPAVETTARRTQEGGAGARREKSSKREAAE